MPNGLFWEAERLQSQHADIQRVAGKAANGNKTLQKRHVKRAVPQRDEGRPAGSLVAAKPVDRLQPVAAAGLELRRGHARYRLELRAKVSHA